MHLRLFIFVYSCILFSCSGNGDPNQLEVKKASNSFVRDLSKNHMDSVLQERTLIGRNYLGGLDTLENGYHDFEIRIWYEYSRQRDRQIVVIKKPIGKDWTAELHTTSWNETPDSFYLSKRTLKTSSPKMGWKLFIDSLKNLHVLTLPSQSDVPNMFESANLSTINVEVADKNHYRFYSYQVPAMHQTKFREAKYLEQILELIEAELGFKRLQKI